MARLCFLPLTERLTRAIAAYFPSMRWTRLRSPPSTSARRPSLRVRRDDFFSRRWARFAWRRRIFPVDVILKRLAAPRCVFILGMVLPGLDLAAGIRAGG